MLNCYNQVKGFVVGRLIQIGLSFAEQIDLGRRFRIQGFLEKGCVELVKTSSVISPDDIDRIGWETYGRISYVRQRMMEQVQSGSMNQVARRTPQVYGGSTWPSASMSFRFSEVGQGHVKSPLIQGEEMDAYIWALLEEQGIRKCW